MADQSEVMVQEICRDIKKLDFAKVGPRPQTVTVIPRACKPLFAPWPFFDESLAHRNWPTLSPSIVAPPLKRHLTETITALRNLGMLASAVDQLEGVRQLVLSCKASVGGICFHAYWTRALAIPPSSRSYFYSFSLIAITSITDGSSPRLSRGG